MDAVATAMAAAAAAQTSSHRGRGGVTVPSTSIATPRVAPTFVEARTNLARQLDRYKFYRVLSVQCTPAAEAGGAMHYTGVAVRVQPSAAVRGGGGGAAAAAADDQPERRAEHVMFRKHDRGFGTGMVVGVALLADAPLGVHHNASVPKPGDVLIGTPVRPPGRAAPKDAPSLPDAAAAAAADGSVRATRARGNGAASNKREREQMSYLKPWRGGAEPLRELTRIVLHGTADGKRLRELLRQPGAKEAEVALRTQATRACAAAATAGAPGGAGAAAQAARELVAARAMATSADDLWMLAHVVLFGEVRTLAWLHVLRTLHGDAAELGLTTQQRALVDGIRISTQPLTLIETLAATLADPTLLDAFYAHLPVQYAAPPAVAAAPQPAWPTVLPPIQSAPTSPQWMPQTPPAYRTTTTSPPLPPPVYMTTSAGMPQAYATTYATTSPPLPPEAFATAPQLQVYRTTTSPPLPPEAYATYKPTSPPLWPRPPPPPPPSSSYHDPSPQWLPSIRAAPPPGAVVTPVPRIGNGGWGAVASPAVPQTAFPAVHGAAARQHAYAPTSPTYPPASPPYAPTTPRTPRYGPASPTYPPVSPPQPPLPTLPPLPTSPPPSAA